LPRAMKAAGGEGSAEVRGGPHRGFVLRGKERKRAEVRARREQIEIRAPVVLLDRAGAQVVDAERESQRTDAEVDECAEPECQSWSDAGDCACARGDDDARALRA